LWILAQICNRQPSLPTAPVSNPTLVSMSSVFRCSAFGQTFKTFLSQRVLLPDKLECFTLYDFPIHTWDECFSVICCWNGYRQKSFISLVRDSPRDTNDRRFDQNKLFVAKKASHAPTWILNGATSFCQRAVSSNSKKLPWGIKLSPNREWEIALLGEAIMFGLLTGQFISHLG